MSATTERGRWVLRVGRRGTPRHFATEAEAQRCFFEEARRDFGLDGLATVAREWFGMDVPPRGWAALTTHQRHAIAKRANALMGTSSAIEKTGRGEDDRA